VVKSPRRISTYATRAVVPEPHSIQQLAEGYSPRCENTLRAAPRPPVYLSKKASQSPPQDL